MSMILSSSSLLLPPAQSCSDSLSHIFHFSYCSFQLVDWFLYFLSLCWYLYLVHTSFFLIVPKSSFSSLTSFKTIVLRSLSSKLAIWSFPGMVSIHFFFLWMCHTFLFLYIYIYICLVILFVENWTFESYHVLTVEFRFSPCWFLGLFLWRSAWNVNLRYSQAFSEPASFPGYVL